MFVVKKILAAFILPPGFFIMIFALSSFLFLKNNRKKEAFSFFLFSVFLWFIMTGFTGSKLKCFLEKEYLKDYPADGDVIIVLSGGVREFKDVFKGKPISLSESSLERVMTAYFLYKKLKLPIIVTGGSIYDSVVESDVAKDFLISLGVKEKDIYVEKYSRDTYENAIFSKKICDENQFKKPIIVTTAWHMKRSLLSYRKAGFNEISFAISGFSCSNKELSFWDFLPTDFQDVREFFHEVLGFYFYKFFY